MLTKLSESSQQMCSSEEHSCLLNVSPTEIIFSRVFCPLHFPQDHPWGWLLWRRREAVQASGLQQHYPVPGSHRPCHGHPGHRVRRQGATGEFSHHCLGAHTPGQEQEALAQSRCLAGIRREGRVTSLLECLLHMHFVQQRHYCMWCAICTLGLGSVALGTTVSQKAQSLTMWL